MSLESELLRPVPGPAPTQGDSEQPAETCHRRLTPLRGRPLADLAEHARNAREARLSFARVLGDAHLI